MLVIALNLRTYTRLTHLQMSVTQSFNKVESGCGNTSYFHARIKRLDFTDVLVANPTCLEE